MSRFDAFVTGIGGTPPGASYGSGSYQQSLKPGDYEGLINVPMLDLKAVKPKRHD